MKKEKIKDKIKKFVKAIMKIRFYVVIFLLIFSYSLALLRPDSTNENQLWQERTGDILGRFSKDLQDWAEPIQPLPIKFMNWFFGLNEKIEGERTSTKERTIGDNIVITPCLTVQKTYANGTQEPRIFSC